MSTDDVELELRSCPACGETKPASAFYKQRTVAYCKGCFKKYMKDRRDQELIKDPVGLRLRELAARAKSRGLECTLATEDVERLLAVQKCQCCDGILDGDKPENAREFDRLDNSMGYVPGNVFALCFQCNRKKADLSIEDLEKILNYMKSPVG